jgi:hypothetical protein
MKAILKFNDEKDAKIEITLPKSEAVTELFKLKKFYGGRLK